MSRSWSRCKAEKKTAFTDRFTDFLENKLLAVRGRTVEDSGEHCSTIDDET